MGRRCCRAAEQPEQPEGFRNDIMGRTLILIRHAPVVRKDLCYGQCDVETVYTAEEAADILMPLLKENRAHEVWASPWQRTRPVAEILAARLGVPAQVDPRLSELYHGDWEGRPFVELEAEFGELVKRYLDNWIQNPPPGGETMQDILRRTGEWLQERRREEGTSIVVAHAGVIRSIRYHLNGGDYAASFGMPVANLVPEWHELDGVSSTA